MSSRWCAFALILLLASTFAPRFAHAQQNTAPTPDEAKRFIEHAEQELAELELKASRAAWVASEFHYFRHGEHCLRQPRKPRTPPPPITPNLAHRYDKVALPSELARKRRLLEHATQFPAPDDAISGKRNLPGF